MSTVSLPLRTLDFEQEKHLPKLFHGTMLRETVCLCWPLVLRFPTHKRQYIVSFFLFPSVVTNLTKIWITLNTNRESSDNVLDISTDDSFCKSFTKCPIVRSRGQRTCLEWHHPPTNKRHRSSALDLSNMHDRHCFRLYTFSSIFRLHSYRTSIGTTPKNWVNLRSYPPPPPLHTALPTSHHFLLPYKKKKRLIEGEYWVGVMLKKCSSVWFSNEGITWLSVGILQFICSRRVSNLRPERKVCKDLTDI